MPSSPLSLDIFYQHSQEPLNGYLQHSLGTQALLHGVFVDIFGKGTMLMGNSGIGKSQCALELLNREHRLIADDVVIFHPIAGVGVMGFCPERLQNLLHIRSLGIIDVMQRFGPCAVISNKRLDLFIELNNNFSEACQLEPKLVNKTILGYNIPFLTLSLALCKNAGILIESAVQCAFSEKSKSIERFLCPADENE